jgi:DNA-binding PadR family transcriptional regulator
MDPRSDQHEHQHEHQFSGHLGHHRGHGPGKREGRGQGGFGRRGRGRGGFGFDPEAQMGRGPRRGRGDVRTAVLMLLIEQPMHGYEMIQQIRERSKEAWSPSPGAIYPTLQLLDGKKVSRLTDIGRTAAEELASTKTAPWDQASADAGTGAHSLREAVFHLMSATKQMAMAGSSAQRQKTTELLDETRKKIYAMLAADES